MTASKSNKVFKWSKHVHSSKEKEKKKKKKKKHLAQTRNTYSGAKKNIRQYYIYKTARNQKHRRERKAANGRETLYNVNLTINHQVNYSYIQWDTP